MRSKTIHVDVTKLSQFIGKLSRKDLMTSVRKVS